jgi:hypothetical protein
VAPAVSFRTKIGALGAILAGVAAPLLWGCHAPPAACGPTEMVLRLPDRDCFMDDVLTVLRRYDLPPERVDRESGLIVSRRTTSGQWFEFWRVDSQGCYQETESSLATIGRIVTVEVTPTGPDGQLTGPAELAPPGGAADEAAATCGDYRVSVCVEKDRLSVPERQITTASGALALFNVRSPTVAGLRGPQSVEVNWIPIGRDPLLEAYLLAKFVEASPEADPAP